MTRFLATALGALALAAPAMAQDAPEEIQRDNRGDIIVEGERQIDGTEVGQLGRDVTGRDAYSGDPLPRFQRPICPGVWGLSEENAQIVINRIYDNAELAGVEINAEPDCPANLWVIFVDDPRETFSQLRSEEAFLVRGLEFFDRKAVSEQEGPVLAWNVTTTRNQDGLVVATPSENAAAFAEARALGAAPPSNNTTNMSRMRTAVQIEIDMSVMLVERSAITGLDALAVGDYATMRLLARTRPPTRENAYDTVLSLFDDGLDYTPPNRLTDFDLAYLQSLYASRVDRPGRTALRNIDELMELQARAE